MNFGHDIENALVRAVEIANSQTTRGGEDQLEDDAALRRWLDHHHVSGRDRVGPKDLADLRILRSRLREVFAAAAEDGDSAADKLNALIAQARAQPRLVSHDGYPWHFHYTPPDAPVAAHLTADAAVALAVLLRDGGHERLGRCAAPDCDGVFVDLTRNRSKRFCDGATCGNRVHVAAYRRRIAAARSA